MIINNTVINKQLTKAIFYNNFKKYLQQDESSNLFMLKSPVMIEGLEFWADFNFQNNILESLKLSIYQSNGPISYSNMFEYKLKDIKEIQDRWLEKQYGSFSEKSTYSTKFNTSFAEIISYIDTKSGETSIIFLLLKFRVYNFAGVKFQYENDFLEIYLFLNGEEGLLLSKPNSSYSEISDWDSYLKEIMTKIESYIPEKYLKAKGWR